MKDISVLSGGLGFGGRAVLASPGGTTIQEAYDAAKALIPVPSLTNTVTVLILAGNYTEDPVFDTNFINVRAVDPQPFVYSTKQGSYIGSISSGFNEATVRIDGDVTISTEIASYYGFLCSNLDQLDTLNNFFHSVYVALKWETSNSTNIVDSYYNSGTQSGAFLGDEITFTGYMKFCFGGIGSFFNGATAVMAGVMEDIVFDDGSMCINGGTLSGRLTRPFTLANNTNEIICGDAVTAGTLSGIVEDGSIDGNENLAGTLLGTPGAVSGTIRRMDVAGNHSGRNAVVTGVIQDVTFAGGAGMNINVGFAQAIMSAARFVRVTAGTNAFGGNGGSSDNNTVYIECECTDVNGWAGLGDVGGTFRRCTAKATTVGNSAIKIIDGATVDNCYFEAESTATFAITSTGAITASILNTAMNLPIDNVTPITNDITTPNNVIDVNYAV